VAGEQKSQRATLYMKEESEWKHQRTTYSELDLFDDIGRILTIRLELGIQLRVLVLVFRRQLF
jgi:hypothetical protein